jgi:hypothetical protein
MDLPARKQSDPPRKSYSDEEVADIYALGRLLLESGNVRRAETVMTGLTEVAPHYAPGWLGIAYVKSISGSYDMALHAAKNALRAVPESVEAMLYVATLSLTLGDFSTAGTYLGEVGERIEQGKVASSSVQRLYRMQLVRFQTRG